MSLLLDILLDLVSKFKIYMNSVATILLIRLFLVSDIS